MVLNDPFIFLHMSTKKEAIPIAKKIVEKVLKDYTLLSEVYEALTSKKEEIRYPNAIALSELGEKIPEKIYPKFDYFVELTKSDNSYHRAIGVTTIADLTKADKENKFEKIFDEYFELLDDRSVMVARYLTMVSEKIMKHKPNLRDKTTKKLLDIDKTHHDPDKKGLIWGDIVEALSVNFKDSNYKEEIIQFAKNQLKNKSPSTVKKAKAFLKQWAT